MRPEEEIKQLGIRRGAAQVGIASVEDINQYAPCGHRPDDILIGAESVIVFAGYHTTRGAWRSPDHRTHHENRDFPGRSISMGVAKFIETNYGYYSIGEIPPAIGLNPSLSLKLCAEMAGLGTRSMAASIILNQKLGMATFSACITTMPLKADGLMDELVCPDPACVKMWEQRRTTPCLETCPECLSGEIGGGRIKWMRYDRRICSTRAQTLGTGALQRILFEVANEPDPEVRRSTLLGSFTQSVLMSIAYAGVAGQCGECLRNCPICLRTRSLKIKVIGSEPV